MDLTNRGSFRLFRLAGIDVYLHWSWFVVAWVQIAYRPDFYHAKAWKVVEYVSLFGIVLMHEFGHALACRSVGGQANTIVLWPLGGVAYVSPPVRPGAVLWSIVAGPLVNVILVPITYSALLWAQSQGLDSSFADVYRFMQMMAYINLALLIFNVLPIYPLDGGQILQSLLWFQLGRWRSLQIASLIGIVFGIGLFACGIALTIMSLFVGGDGGGFMLSVLAAFIVFRSVIGFQQARGRLHLLALPRHHDCSCPHCGIGPPRGLFWVCEHCQSRFDIFDRRGKCPACGAWYLEPACPNCHRSKHIDKWFGEAEPLDAVLVETTKPSVSAEQT